MPKARDDIWTLVMIDEIGEDEPVPEGHVISESHYEGNAFSPMSEYLDPSLNSALASLEAAFPLQQEGPPPGYTPYAETAAGRAATIPENTVIKGQLPFVDLRESGEAGVYVDMGIPGRRLPLSQWVRGDAQNITFTAMIVNDPTLAGWEPAGPSIVAKYRQILKASAAPHPRLKRPPRWRFTWTEISVTCFVQSVSQIVYRDTDGRGRVHRATFEVELKILEDELVRTNTVNLEAPERILKERETAEMIAKKYTKRPELGVPLRQSQEELRAFGRSGMMIKLVDGQILRYTGIAPQTTALQVARGDVAGAVATLMGSRAVWRRPDGNTPGS